MTNRNIDKKLPFFVIRKCSVVNRNGRFVGLIRNGIIDFAERRIVNVTICMLGFLGMETKHIVIPFSELSFDPKIGKFILASNELDLEQCSRNRRAHEYLINCISIN